MRKNGIIIKEYAGNTAQEIKLHVMTPELPTQIADGIKSIHGLLRPNEYIRNRTNGLQSFILTEKRLAHVVALELTQEANSVPYFSGFHCDRRDILKHSGIFNEVNILSDNPITKVVTLDAKLLKSDPHPQYKTLFPPDWSVQDILKYAQEALTNCCNKPRQKGNRYEIMGITKMGLK